MKSQKQSSYLGKKVFVGIDVHKTSYSVVARVDQTIVKKWTTAASPRDLSQQLIKYFDGWTNPHALRHIAAKHIRQTPGKDAGKLAKLMGHSLKTADAYAAQILSEYEETQDFVDDSGESGADQWSLRCR